MIKQNIHMRCLHNIPRFFKVCIIHALTYFFLDDFGDLNGNIDTEVSIKRRTKEQIGSIIGKQLSMQHEWLPQCVIGVSGVRPLTHAQGIKTVEGNGVPNISREGVRASSAFSSLCNTQVFDGDEVDDEEWEVTS